MTPDGEKLVFNNGRHTYVSYSEQLSKAQARGITELATAIYELSYSLWRTPTAFFPKKEPRAKMAVIEDISAILSRMSKQTITALIKNQLHSFYDRNTHYEFCLPTHQEGQCIPSFPYENSRLNSARPIIYGLVVCTHQGDLPTSAQMRRAIEKMERYALKIHPFYTGTQNQKQLDEEAFEIDFWMTYTAGHRLTRPGAQRDLIEGRNTMNEFNNRNSMDIEKLLILQKQVETRNLQTYYDVSNDRKSTNTRTDIRRWCEIMKSRLDQVPLGQENTPIPWSIINIGWTTRPDKRRSEHFYQRGHSHRMKKYKFLPAIGYKSLTREVYS